jgi:predicted nucleotidyltransferase
MTQDAFYQRVVDVLQAYYRERREIAAVYLYGSVVKGRLTPESDIDIGVLYDAASQRDFQKHADDQTALTAALGREVDLVSLAEASPILRYQVLKYGERVLTRDPKTVNLFFVRTVNEYCDLKVIRREIERHMKEVRIL